MAKRGHPDIKIRRDITSQFRTLPACKVSAARGLRAVVFQALVLWASDFQAPGLWALVLQALVLRVVGWQDLLVYP